MLHTFQEPINWLADTGVDPSSLQSYGIAGTFAAMLAAAVVYVDRRRTAIQEKLTETHDEEISRLLAEVADTKARADALISQERARGDRLEGELARLNTMVQTQVLTALNEATRAVSDAIAAVRSAK